MFPVVGEGVGVTCGCWTGQCGGGRPRRGPSDGQDSPSAHQIATVEEIGSERMPDLWRTRYAEKGMSIFGRKSRHPVGGQILHKRLKF